MLENVSSGWLPVASGMLQGSILGPLIFLKFINDISNVVSSGTTVLFGDDAECIQEIKSHNDSVSLQRDLESFIIVKWKI